MHYKLKYLSNLASCYLNTLVGSVLMIYVGWSSEVAPRTNALHNVVSISSVQYLLSPRI